MDLSFFKKPLNKLKTVKSIPFQTNPWAFNAIFHPGIKTRKPKDPNLDIEKIRSFLGLYLETEGSEIYLKGSIPPGCFINITSMEIRKKVHNATADCWVSVDIIHPIFKGFLYKTSPKIKLFISETSQSLNLLESLE